MKAVWLAVNMTNVELGGRSVTDLISANKYAKEWLEEAKNRYVNNGLFGKIFGGVLWCDQLGQDGKPIVSLDPSCIVNNINKYGNILLNGHDPGLPLGKVIAAECFVSSEDRRFIVGLLGLYHGGSQTNFGDLGVDPTPLSQSPSTLLALPNNSRVEICHDSREFKPSWIKSIIEDAPLLVKRTELSHNSAEALLEILKIGLPYAALIWNPLVTTIANEAGKDIYIKLKTWLRRILEKMSDLQNPVLEIISNQSECQISFIFRGKNINIHYSAHEALPGAAANAALLVGRMNLSNLNPGRIVYEYDSSRGNWHPSYAELKDGRFVNESVRLIALEQLPNGLSPGFAVTKEKDKLSSKPYKHIR